MEHWEQFLRVDAGVASCARVVKPSGSVSTEFLSLEAFTGNCAAETDVKKTTFGSMTDPRMKDESDEDSGIWCVTYDTFRYTLLIYSSR